MKYPLFLIIFSLITTSINAQSFKYLKGYVVTETNDTIHCKILDVGLVESHTKVKMRTMDGEKIKLKKRDIKSYATRGKTYVKKKVVESGFINNIEYMELLEKGSINLYTYRRQQEGKPPQIDYYEFSQSYFLEKEGKFERVKGLFFRAIVAEYISDNPELLQKVSDKELKFDDLQDIIAKYNIDKS